MPFVFAVEIKVTPVSIEGLILRFCDNQVIEDLFIVFATRDPLLGRNNLQI